MNMLWFAEAHNSEGATISEQSTVSVTVFLMYSAIRPNTTFGKLRKSFVLKRRSERMGVVE